MPRCDHPITAWEGNFGIVAWCTECQVPVCRGCRQRHQPVEPATGQPKDGATLLAPGCGCAGNATNGTSTGRAATGNVARVTALNFAIHQLDRAFTDHADAVRRQGLGDDARAIIRDLLQRCDTVRRQLQELLR